MFIEQLVPEHSDIVRRLDPQAHLFAFHPKNGDADIASDHHCFACVTPQYRHEESSVIPPGADISASLLATLAVFLAPVEPDKQLCQHTAIKSRDPTRKTPKPKALDEENGRQKSIPFRQ